MMYVGLDVHKHVCCGTVMDEKGKAVKQAKFTNAPERLEEFMEGLEEARWPWRRVTAGNPSTTGWRRRDAM